MRNHAIWQFLDTTAGYAKLRDSLTCPHPRPLSLRAESGKRARGDRKIPRECYMSILVVCTGCKKSFQVNDKFAGKSGPCPKCKTVIRVPEKSAEVKVHTPEAFGTGGRSTTGKLLLKPIDREDVKFRPVMGYGVGGAVLGLLAATWVLGLTGLLENYVVRGAALLVISPVLAVSAYTFLRDDELEPYRGRELFIRAGICSAVYMILWATFAYVMNNVNHPVELWLWFVIGPPLIAIGAAAGWLSFDIEPGDGFCHYSFYLLVTVLLGWVGRLGWVWDVGK